MLGNGMVTGRLPGPKTRPHFFQNDRRSALKRAKVLPGRRHWQPGGEVLAPGQKRPPEAAEHLGCAGADLSARLVNGLFNHGIEEILKLHLSKRRMRVGALARLGSLATPGTIKGDKRRLSNAGMNKAAIGCRTAKDGQLFSGSCGYQRCGGWQAVVEPMDAVVVKRKQRKREQQALSKQQRPRGAVGSMLRKGLSQGRRLARRSPGRRRRNREYRVA